MKAVMRDRTKIGETADSRKRQRRASERIKSDEQMKGNSVGQTNRRANGRTSGGRSGGTECRRKGREERAGGEMGERT